MTQGIKSNEPDARTVYADIIDLPHHQSSTHPHMSLYDRAAQFSSYKALSGYEDMVAEEARLTFSKPELAEYELELLNQKLNLIADVVDDGTHPTVTISYFVPDERKSGGAVVDITDTIKRIDNVSGQVILMSTRESGINEVIEIKSILSIRGDLVDNLNDE